MNDRQPINPAADTPDPLVREAFRVLFAQYDAPKQLGARWRVRSFVDMDGVQLLLFQFKDATGKYVTKAALRGDTGGLYLAGTVASAQDFASMGWEPGV